MNIDRSKSSARALADLDAGLVVATVDIASSAERVFRALTDAKELVQWWGSPETYRAHRWDANFQVGGRWRVEGKSANGDAFSVFGEFLENAPPRRIVQTWSYDWDKDRPTTKLTYLLEDISGGTRVTVRHEGFVSCEVCSSHAAGWERVLQWLESYVEASVVPGSNVRGS
ncbi:MAG: SRPBCC domain-containing protein [Myxococcota bacterium]|nr:SRPBCC domain-containing protein [Myxococcota bacterium]